MIVHYFTMYIWENKKTVFGHHNGAIMYFCTWKHKGNIEKLGKLRANLVRKKWGPYGLA